MSIYYNPQRTRNIFDPNSRAAFRISRSKIELFIECPCCFYVDKRLGIARPPSYPFTLNSAVDALLKKEFDLYRSAQNPHPLCIKQGIDVVPFAHPDLNEWRDNFKGLQFHYEPLNLIITGALDDIWVGRNTTLFVADYKATAKDGQVSLDEPWQIVYKRQMEIYQWLLRKRGFNVSDTGYFIYCNGITGAGRFDARLEFDISIIPYTGNGAWIEKTLAAIHACLISNDPPPPHPDCDYCRYRSAVNMVL
ncbi:PD-(D/E)XK nuclease family protein [bacterium]|nr:PD-(D/E)XK nuclease family protein [bacterium]